MRRSSMPCGLDKLQFESDWGGIRKRRLPQYACTQSEQGRIDIDHQDQRLRVDMPALTQ